MGETKKHFHNILHIQFTVILIILVQALKTWEDLFLSPKGQLKIQGPVFFPVGPMKVQPLISIKMRNIQLLIETSQA